MRFFRPSHRNSERLLWSRDSRFVKRIRTALPTGRSLDLESGTCFIAAASALTDAFAGDIAARSHHPDFGLVDIDERLPEPDRYLVALSLAVQTSGIADRIGMAQTTQVIEGKTLDYFFNLRNNHQVVFQPIVSLATGELHEYECLFRPVMPMLPQSISAIVQAAIDTARSVELDAFIIRTILARAGELGAAWPDDLPRPRFAVNVTPASLLDSRFEARAFAAMTKAAGLHPGQITVECTEQQSVSDVEPLKREVKALRRLGFGFAIDDAGAGYASFTLIATLRPSIIKIDRQIVHGIGTHDARQALVEAFVSFSRRIGARLIAEGIETHSELTTLKSLGVELGQGFLIGRPSPVPRQPRHVDPAWQRAARDATRRPGAARRAGPTSAPAES